MEVGQHTALCNGHAREEELVKFFVVADSQLKVTRDNASFLVVAGSVTGKLKDPSSYSITAAR